MALKALSREAISTDDDGDDQTPAKEKHRVHADAADGGWSDRTEQVLLQWKRHFQMRAWMHAEAASYYGQLRLWIGLPGILFGAVVTSSLGGSIGDGWHLPDWLRWIVLVASLCANVFAALQTFLGTDAKNQAHTLLADEYKHLVRKLQLEFGLDASERVPRKLFFSQISRESDRIIEKSTPLPSYVQWRAKRYSRKQHVELDLESGPRLHVEATADDENMYFDSTRLAQRLRQILDRSRPPSVMIPPTSAA